MRKYFRISREAEKIRRRAQSGVEIFPLIPYNYTMLAYYNELAQYPAQWLRNLHPDADVDDRSIADVGVDDVAAYDRVHLFAGIGGWEYALRLAGWPDSEPVWTGSCPCQPFSQCGKKRGREDERHLWPEMFRLISANHPPTIFGEQVTGKAGLGWFDGVRVDLEGIGYSCGMAVLPAACVGSPHKRDRIFWVADAAWPPRDRPIVRSDARAHGRVPGSEWSDYYSYPCSDGKVRRVGRRVQPLDARISGDLDQLLAYGNSIVPQVATEFVSSYMDIAFGEGGNCRADIL